MVVVADTLSEGYQPGVLRCCLLQCKALTRLSHTATTVSWASTLPYLKGRGVITLTLPLLFMMHLRTPDPTAEDVAMIRP